ncbi:carboxypeptidase-like regulatory domain-containing protein [Rufibacter roseolus]|uniref:carboxypeptidase-like regulatory domain-containing protein n=1 Tax=Rufibacter roseolus TaxID=2817375 RepID=UPI001B300EC2|nr:carboxypeptidase-like regulatory domain-containing protein [Rufibacter roseolus]
MILALMIVTTVCSCSHNVTRAKKDNSIMEIKRIGVMDTLIVNVSGKLLSLYGKFGLPGAKVKFINKENSFSKICNEDGGFEFRHIPSGKYQITSSYIGYYSLTDSVEFKTGDIVEIKVRLWADY